MTRPTKKQTELLEYLRGFITSTGYGPSYREIQRALDYKSVSTVATHIDGLVSAGRLRKRDRSARSIEIIETKQLTLEQEKWILKKTEEVGFEKAKSSLNSIVKL